MRLLVVNANTSDVVTGALEIQRSLDMAQMLHHQRRCALSVARLDGVDQVAVFMVRAGRHIGRVVQDDDQAGQGLQFAHRLGKKAVAGGLGDHLVELARQPDDGPLVVGGASRRLLGHMFAQTLDITGLSQPRRLANQIRLDQAPRRKDLARFFDRRAADECTTVGHDSDDAVMGQAL